MYTQRDFKKLDINRKINALTKDGESVCMRHYLNYEVFLYCYNGFYVEVWIRPEFREVVWVELAPRQSVINAYQNDIDISDLFGTD